MLVSQQACGEAYCKPDIWAFVNRGIVKLKIEIKHFAKLFSTVDNIIISGISVNDRQIMVKKDKISNVITFKHRFKI